MSLLAPLAFGALLLILCRSFLLLLLRQQCSPLRFLPGPPSPSFLTGNLEQMHDMENNNLISSWVSKYGHSFVYRGFIGGCRLMTTDPLAIAHILGNAYDYPKPDFVRQGLADMAAGREGMLTVEGDVHRRQRKILSPAFTSTHIKSLTPIFWDKATELRDIWLAQVDSLDDVNPDTDGRDTSITRVDVLLWLGRATLDVIGLAGFGYAFNALTDDTNELARAFSIIFSTARKFRVITILQVWFPFLRRFRRNNATMEQAQATMRRIGLELIEERKSEVLGEGAVPVPVPSFPSSPIPVTPRTPMRATHEHDRDQGSEGEKTGLWASYSYGHSAPPTPSTFQSEGTKDSFQGRDILSVLIRSNLSSDPSQQMSEEEVLCQISTFLAAGHETTSSALTWCLYALAKDRRVQDKLRTSLRAIDVDVDGAVGEGDRGQRQRQRRRRRSQSRAEHEHENENATQTENESSNITSTSTSVHDVKNDSDLTERIVRCTYLDWVVRESLRVHAPVTNTMRVCMRDEDEIPVRSPVSSSFTSASAFASAALSSRRGASPGGSKTGDGVGGSEKEKGKENEKEEKNTGSRITIPVRKWDIISVPIQAINKSEVFWGEDARVFRPERWATPPQDARAIQGLYANTLTFLNGNPLGGNRACIGYKFALIEIKIFLYVLVKDLEFSIDPSMVIEKKVNVVTRPFVKSEPHLGNQMPLNISRASHSASVLDPGAQLAEAPTISPPTYNVLQQVTRYPLIN